MHIHYNACPVCGGETFKEVLQTNDFSHTQDSFKILECNHCQLRFTQDIPDQNNIGKYYEFSDYISHNNEAKGLINNLYLKARNYTLSKKYHWLKKYLDINKASIGDIGSGTGAFVSYLKNKGVNINGFELSEAARAAALTNFNTPLMPMEGWLQSNNTYNALTLWHVMEHIHELDLYWKKFYDSLTDNGFLFIAVPNYTSAEEAYYKKYWAAYDVPRHLYHFAPVTLQHLATKYNFKLVNTIPLWLDGYYISLLSEKHKKSSLSFLKGAWQGAKTHLKLWFNKNKASSLVYVLQKQ
jgi:2-polyprenyl-3-methyl-5-hydroxy-6-metoxy-1,4-benzoquinol methylase